MARSGGSEGEARPGRRSLRSKLLSAVWFLLHRSGLLFLGIRLVRAFGGGCARVLCYHRVSASGRPGDLHPERFRGHLRYLRRHYRWLDAAELAALLAEGKTPPRDAIVLTIDDGYRDLLPEAVPVLLEEGAPATFFVLTGDLPRAGRLWLDRIDGTALEHRRAELARMSTEDRAAALSDLDEPDGDSPGLFTAEDLRELRRAEFPVGSHGRTHAVIPALPVEEARREISGSLEDLVREIGERPALLAFPWGAVSDEVAGIAREAGYRGAFLTSGAAAVPGTDPFRIPRIHVPGNASVSRLACEAAGLITALRRRR